MKKPKKPSEATLKKLRMAACLKHDGDQCMKCGRTDTLAPSHIYSQGRYPRMKWELDNIIPLCYQHHIHWWHKEPMEAKDWLKKVLPEARLARLKKMSQDNNLPKPDLLKVKELYLKEKAPFD